MGFGLPWQEVRFFFHFIIVWGYGVWERGVFFFYIKDKMGLNNVSTATSCSKEKGKKPISNCLFMTGVSSCLPLLNSRNLPFMSPSHDP